MRSVTGEKKHHHYIFEKRTIKKIIRKGRNRAVLYVYGGKNDYKDHVAGVNLNDIANCMVGKHLGFLGGVIQSERITDEKEPLTSPPPPAAFWNQKQAPRS